MRRVRSFLVQHALEIVTIVFLVGSVICSWRITRYGREPRQWAFLPYDLRINTGTNGDGSLGYPPGAVSCSPRHNILKGPLELSRRDLGWCGDQIVAYDEENWIVVATIEGSERKRVPAILEASYGNGSIVYVTSPLSRHDRLLLNILMWKFGRLDKDLNIAVMTDVVAWEPENWVWCFSSLNKTAKEKGYGCIGSPEEVHQFVLNDEELDGFDVLVLASGWGDGYYSPDWSWNRKPRDDAIRRFVRRGGLLLLSEAGFVDRWPRFIDMIGSVFCFPEHNISLMVQISLVSIWGVYTSRELSRGLYRHHGILCFILLVGAIFWFSGLLTSRQLMPIPFFFIVSAVFVDMLALAIALCLGLLMRWRSKVEKDTTLASSLQSKSF